MANSDVNYDTVQTFHVSPAAMLENVNKVKQWNAEINRELKVIQDTFMNLALAWAGETKQEATEVVNSWNAVAVELFGTGVPKDEPEDKVTPSQLGVLNFIVLGMAGATNIYATVEVGLEKYYKDFRNALASAPAPSGGPTNVDSSHEDIVDTHQTAVGESW